MGGDLQLRAAVPAGRLGAPAVRAEIVAVGTELLLGQIANTNAAWLSERLAEIGVDVLHHQVVGDNAGRIEEAIATAVARSDVVVVSGGLGPIQDDITRTALARIFIVLRSWTRAVSQQPERQARRTSGSHDVVW